MSDKKKIIPEELSKPFLQEAAKFTKEMDKEHEAILVIYKAKLHMETVSAGNMENMEDLFANLFQKEPQLLSVVLHAASRSIPNKDVPDISDIAEALEDRIKGIFKGEGPKVRVIDGTELMKDIKKDLSNKPAPMGEPGEA